MQENALWEETARPNTRSWVFHTRMSSLCAWVPGLPFLLPGQKQPCLWEGPRGARSTSSTPRGEGARWPLCLPEDPRGQSTAGELLPGQPPGSAHVSGFLFQLPPPLPAEGPGCPVMWDSHTCCLLFCPFLRVFLSSYKDLKERVGEAERGFEAT